LMTEKAKNVGRSSRALKRYIQEHMRGRLEAMRSRGRNQREDGLARWIRSGEERDEGDGERRGGEVMTPFLFATQPVPAR
jgi:hypothetical protein